MGKRTSLSPHSVDFSVLEGWSTKGQAIFNDTRLKQRETAHEHRAPRKDHSGQVWEQSLFSPAGPSFLQPASREHPLRAGHQNTERKSRRGNKGSVR